MGELYDRRYPSRVGEQLELELAGPGRSWNEPWAGKSPRVLTKVSQVFSLGAPPLGGLPRMSRPADDERSSCVQLELLL